jgi:outer membrane protein assembly factor BamE (lipoprotein component of BamABCDE complex)
LTGTGPAWDRIAAMRCRHPLSRLLPVLAFNVLLAGVLGGCAPGFWSYEPQVRGNIVDTGQLKQLVPGTSTEADATALLGSPTAKGSFDPNTWIYIGQITRPEIAAFQRVERQDVVVLSFDSAGVLQKVEQKTGKDALPAPMIARTTPSPGGQANILQQVLGNVGRFSTTPNTPSQAPSGGSPGSGNY